MSEGLREFERLCALSSDCRDHETTLTPGRTQCQADPSFPPDPHNVRCVRALHFDIGQKKEHEEPKPRLPEPTHRRKADQGPLLELPDFLSDPPSSRPWGINFMIGYHESPLAGIALQNGPLLFGVTLERRLTYRLSIAGTYEWLTNAHEPDEYFGELDMGPGFSARLMSLSLPIYLSATPEDGWYIAPAIGTMTYDLVTAPQNPFYDPDVGGMQEYLPETEQDQALCLGLELGYINRWHILSLGWRSTLRSYADERNGTSASALGIQVFMGFNF